MNAILYPFEKENSVNYRAYKIYAHGDLRDRETRNHILACKSFNSHNYAILYSDICIIFFWFRHLHEGLGIFFKNSFHRNTYI